MAQNPAVFLALALVVSAVGNATANRSLAAHVAKTDDDVVVVPSGPKAEVASALGEIPALAGAASRVVVKNKAAAGVSASCSYTPLYVKYPPAGKAFRSCTLSYSAYTAQIVGYWSDYTGYSYISLSSARVIQQIAYVCNVAYIGIAVCI